MGVGIAVGSSINATVFSPLLGGWRNVLFLWGAVSIILSILWSFSRRNSELTIGAADSHMRSLYEGISQVSKIKSVWMLALSGALLTACQMGMFGYLPLFLRNSGWNPQSADIAFSLLGVLGAVGAISISFVSDRIGSRKNMLLVIHVATTLTIGMLAVANFHMIWILIITVGLVREAYPAISTTFLMELKEIDRKNLGTAMGLRGSVMVLGSFFGPPLGNSLAGINAGLPFIFWAALALSSIIFLFMINE
jgi:NNP family nitrate/nitrite transporter-like MFS transporter